MKNISDMSETELREAYEFLMSNEFRTVFKPILESVINAKIDGLVNSNDDGDKARGEIKALRWVLSLNGIVKNLMS